MMSRDNVQANIEKIKALFPNAVTEVIRDGKTTLAVDFDVLKQEMSDILIDDKEERYQFTWPDKKKSILLANSPISATLRPCKEESVDFDNTENLYIEGDNLDVLKLLQETYLGKIKMIYIDPPYNTGNDFVYNDDFAESSEEYLANSGQYDEQGNRLVVNTESNGRFHTDWLNMIYPRLKIAKDLLADDGVIFISIDDYEIENLTKVCNEIFGENNMAAIVHRRKNRKPHNAGTTMSLSYEFILVYYKNESFKLVQEYAEMKSDEGGNFAIYPVIKADKKLRTYTIKAGTLCEIAEINAGVYKAGRNENLDIEYLDGTTVVDGRTTHDVRLTARYCLTDENGKFSEAMRAGNIFINSNGFPKEKRYRGEEDFKVDNHHWDIDGGKNEDGDEEIKKLFNIKGQNYLFSYPKPVALLLKVLSTIKEKDYYVLDFFSGSATTAHAVMQLNAEDGGNRKFIMVQLPEMCDESSEAYKAGYKNICEIGKERIRRTGKKILEQNELSKETRIIDTKEQLSVLDALKGNESAVFDFIKTQPATDLSHKNLDVGFRVLKLDSSNMKDVFYRPAELTLDMLAGLESNIKEDRTPLDLLFQVMLELGKQLSAKIEEKVIAGKKVFVVDDNDLIACFDENITEEVVKTIAQMKPLYAVFRDNSFASDTVATNFDQIFATYSPDTTRKVL